MSPTEKFNIDLVRQHFESSVKDEDDVLMDPYLEGYKELMR